MDTRTREIIETFGHEAYQAASTGLWTCDHDGHGGDDFETREETEKACLALAEDAHETDMLRDESHPSLEVA